MLSIYKNYLFINELKLKYVLYEHYLCVVFYDIRLYILVFIHLFKIFLFETLNLTLVLNC